jgi:hypothetical protein
MARGVLGEPNQLRIRAGARNYLGISRGDHAPSFALERPSDNRGAAGTSAGIHHFIDEVDELIWKANGYLLAHPNMVPSRYHAFDAVLR